jgi:hypothetical protein
MSPTDLAGIPDHSQGESDEALLQKMEQEQEQLSAEGLAELQSDEENDQ